MAAPGRHVLQFGKDRVPMLRVKRQRLEAHRVEVGVTAATLDGLCLSGGQKGLTYPLPRRPSSTHRISVYSQPQ